MYMLKKITIVNPPRFYTEPSDGYETEVMEVTKLTEKVIILKIKDSEGYVDEVIECRVL